MQAKMRRWRNILRKNLFSTLGRGLQLPLLFQRTGKKLGALMQAELQRLDLELGTIRKWSEKQTLRVEAFQQQLTDSLERLPLLASSAVEQDVRVGLRLAVENARVLQTMLVEHESGAVVAKRQTLTDQNAVYEELKSLQRRMVWWMSALAGLSLYLYGSILFRLTWWADKWIKLARLPLGLLWGTVALCTGAGFLYLLREYRRRLYAVTEIGVAIVAMMSAVTSVRATPAVGVDVWLKVGTAVYLLVRGLDNLLVGHRQALLQVQATVKGWRAVHRQLVRGTFPVKATAVGQGELSSSAPRLAS